MRRLAIIGVALCLTAPLLWAKPGSVRTRDGRNIEGDITEDGDSVVIAMKAASITLPRTDIESITYAASIEEQYKQRLASLPAGAGARSHLDLARWLYDNRAYALARKEATTAIELEPNNAEAVMLRQTIDRTMAWEKNPAKPAADGPTSRPAVEAAANAPASRPARAQRRLLNAEQINAIRQHEVKETERLRVRFDNGVIRRYAEGEKGDMHKFNTSPDMVKAWAIMKNPDLRKDVHILSDPAALAEYRKVQPFILAGCATTACHGGVNAGSFALVNPPDSEAATYTNFYILSKYTVPADGATMKLIDRQTAANSLLLQYASAKDQSKHPHPQATGFAPIFRNGTDARRATLNKWLGMLAVPEPDYGFDFPVQADGAAAQPGVAGLGGATGAATPDKPQKTAPPASRPANTPANASQPPANQPNQNNGQNADDTMKDIRSRLRPIRGL